MARTGLLTLAMLAALAGAEAEAQSCGGCDDDKKVTATGYLLVRMPKHTEYEGIPSPPQRDTTTPIGGGISVLGHLAGGYAQVGIDASYTPPQKIQFTDLSLGRFVARPAFLEQRCNAYTHVRLLGQIHPLPQSPVDPFIALGFGMVHASNTLEAALSSFYASRTTIDKESRTSPLGTAGIGANFWFSDHVGVTGMAAYNFAQKGRIPVGPGYAQPSNSTGPELKVGVSGRW